MKVDPETGEILKEKKTSLVDFEDVLIIPYFEKSETEGRELKEKTEFTPKRIFEILESTVSDPVYFEERQLSIYDDQAIRLKAKQSEEQTIADLVACILKRKNDRMTNLSDSKTTVSLQL